jgi:hypothetical protein
MSAFDIDAETLDAHVDDRPLTCAPAKRDFMASRYFLF